MNRNRQALADLRRIKLFSTCTDTELVRILGLTTPLHLRAGTVLATEGRYVREFIVIVSGAADVTAHGHHVATIGPDDFIGETSLGAASRHPRTVTARTDLDILVSNPREFRQIVESSPVLSRRLLVPLADRTTEAVSPATRSAA